MQLTLSIKFMKVPISVAIMQVLGFYCDYIAGTFCRAYVGGSSYCSYEYCSCNYAVRSFCNTYATENFSSKYAGDNFF